MAFFLFAKVGKGRLTLKDFEIKKSYICSSLFRSYIYIYLGKRFHVAVRLFSNRSQKTSKCGKNKKVAYEAIAECVTNVLTTF